MTTPTPPPDQLLAALEAAGFRRYSTSRDGSRIRMVWPRGSAANTPSVVVPLNQDTPRYRLLVAEMLATLEQVAAAGVTAAAVLEALRSTE